MATDWPADEALANPDIWLGVNPHMHCLQHMALLPGNLGDTLLLLRLKGQNVSCERQLVALICKHHVADNVQGVVLFARACVASKNDTQLAITGGVS